MFSDSMKIGMFLTAFGVFFTFLGIVFFLDRGLLAIGNLAFLFGLTLIIGFGKMRRWLLQRHKLRGTVCFLGGIVLVLSGWALIGLALEIFGFVSLFGNPLPNVLAVLRHMPVVGTLLSLPFIAPLVDRIVGNSLPV